MFEESDCVRTVSPAATPAALLAWATATAVLAFGGPQPLRGAVVFSFALFAPGFAAVRLLGVDDVATRVVLAISVSLALETVAALLMVYTGTWSPPGLFLVLAIAVGAVSAVEFRRPRVHEIVLNVEETR